MICINCKHEHSFDYCPKCGEKAQVPKITFVSIFKDGFSTITNMDKGLLFNIKHIAIRPKQIVNDYLQGKRKSILNPVSFLIISITIYLIVNSLGDTKSIDSNRGSEAYSIGVHARNFILSYFKYFWILSVIWMSVATKIFFRRYNFAEHLTINSFVIGQATLVGLISYLVYPSSLFLTPWVYLAIAWLIYEIFKAKRLDLPVLFKSLGTIILFFLQIMLIGVLIGSIINRT
ncbi:MAG: DUF3667 domain-containing protein [Bacteroidota bacterium]